MGDFLTVSFRKSVSTIIGAGEAETVSGISGESLTKKISMAGNCTLTITYLTLIDEKRLKSVVASHRETWYALSRIKNDKRYKSLSDKMLQKRLFIEFGLEKEK